MLVHEIATLYPGLDPMALRGADADAWLRHLTLLRLGGVIGKEPSDG